MTSYSSNDDAACDDDVTTRTITERVAVAVTLTLVIVVTVGGNLLVCVTVMTIRALHSTTNYFILSLSLSDLLLGCLVNIPTVINHHVSCLDRAVICSLDYRARGHGFKPRSS